MRRNVAVIFTIAFVFAAAFIYYTNTNDSINTDKIIESQDTQLTNAVVEIEKNLVLAEIHRISLDDFKKSVDPYFHSLYQEAYFDEVYKKDSNLAISIIPPVSQRISKVYTSSDKEYKYIYVKIPVEGTTSQIGKLYTFKKDKDEWRIFSVSNYILAIERQEPKKIIEKFNKFDGKQIEYETITILDK